MMQNPTGFTITSLLDSCLIYEVINCNEAHPTAVNNSKLMNMVNVYIKKIVIIYKQFHFFSDLSKTDTEKALSLVKYKSKNYF